MGDDGQSRMGVGEQVPKKGGGGRCLLGTAVIFTHVYRISIVRHGSTTDSKQYRDMLPLIVDEYTKVTMCILAANTNKDWYDLLPAFRG